MVAQQDGGRYGRRFQTLRQPIGIVGLGSVLSMCLITLLPDLGFAKEPRHHRAAIHPVSLSQQELPWKKVPANSVFLKELRSGRVLYQHDSEKRLSPASLTKIMSALVILEYGHLDEHATISKNAARAPKTHLRLRTGEVFRLDDLLKAMLIVSANDACLAAVEHVGGTEEQFVAMMNAKVTQLGLTDTHFSNGCGFDSPEHYSTAEDLAKLSEVAMQNPVFRELVREERDLIMPVSGHRPYLLHTTNRLLGHIPGVEGVKTGFTSKAGRCLIAKVSQNGSDLLLVILNSNRRWNMAKSLITYGLRVSEPVQ